MKWWTPYYEAYLVHTYLTQVQRAHVEAKVGKLGFKAFLWWVVVHLLPASCVIVGCIWLDFVLRK